MTENNEEVKNNEDDDWNISPYENNGYCPYTEDRNCRIDKEGFVDGEKCQHCGWRAW